MAKMRLIREIVATSIQLRWASAFYYFSLAFSLALGYVLVGPFFDSPFYSWIEREARNNVLVANFVDVQDLLVDTLVATSVPLFLTWSIVFLIYGELEQVGASLVNRLSRVLSFFTGGPGTFTALLGASILGVVIYGARYEDVRQTLYVVAVLGLLLVIAGHMVRIMSRPRINHPPWLRRYSAAISAGFALLALCAYLYGLVSDPIQMYWVFRDTFLAH